MLHQCCISFHLTFVQCVCLKRSSSALVVSWCTFEPHLHCFLILVLVSRCQTGSNQIKFNSFFLDLTFQVSNWFKNRRQRDRTPGSRRWVQLEKMKITIPVTMTMPRRMGKHSVEKTRVSSELVSVSPPPPPPPPPPPTIPPPLRSALSQHDRQIIAVPTSRRPQILIIFQNKLPTLG